MRIETTFNIGDLVQPKFSRPQKDKDTAAAYEIIEIKTVTCYQETQVFFECRAHHFMFDTNWRSKEKPREIVDVVTGFGKERNYFGFRGDEVKPCDPEIEAEIRKFQLDPQ